MTLNNPCCQKDDSRQTQSHRVPIILIVGDAAEAMVADRADVACVLLERDPAIAAYLAAALAALADGAQPNIAARPIEAGQESRRIVSPHNASSVVLDWMRALDQTMPIISTAHAFESTAPRSAED